MTTAGHNLWRSYCEERNPAASDHQLVLPTITHQQLHVKGEGKGQVLAIALLTRELVTRSTLQSRKWQLVAMS